GDAEAVGRGDHVGHADELQRLDRRDVARLGQRGAYGQWARELVVEIVRLVTTGERGRDVPHDRRRIPALAERGDIRERLQRGTGLSRRDRHVDLTVDAGIV